MANFSYLQNVFMNILLKINTKAFRFYAPQTESLVTVN